MKKRICYLLLLLVVVSCTDEPEITPPLPDHPPVPKNLFRVKSVADGNVTHLFTYDEKHRVAQVRTNSEHFALRSTHSLYYDGNGQLSSTEYSTDDGRNSWVRIYSFYGEYSDVETIFSDGEERHYLSYEESDTLKYAFINYNSEGQISQILDLDHTSTLENGSQKRSFLYDYEVPNFITDFNLPVTADPLMAISMFGQLSEIFYEYEFLPTRAFIYNGGSPTVWEYRYDLDENDNIVMITLDDNLRAVIEWEEY